MFKVSLNNNKVAIDPTKRLGDEWQTYREVVQNTGGKATKQKDGTWSTLWDTKDVLKASAGFRAVGWPIELPPEVLDLLQREEHRTQEDVRGIDSQLDAADRILAALGGGVRGYQREDALTLYKNRTHLLCNPVGTGKSLTALCAVPEGMPVLVVCPAGVRTNWRNELRKWGKPAPTVCTKKSEQYATGAAVVYGYSNLPTTTEGLPVTPVCLVLDEAHYLKNPKAQRTKKAKALIKHVQSPGGLVYALTATPMLNRPKELYDLLSILGLAKKAFGGWKGFYRAFNCYKQRIGYREVTVYGEPSADVPVMLSKVAIMRERKELVEQMPDYLHQDIVVSLPAKELREITRLLPKTRAEIDELIEAATGSRSAQFEEFSLVKTILSKVKAKAALEEVQTYVEAVEPVVVVSTSLEALESLKEALGDDCGIITGATNGEERECIRSAFFAKQFPVLLCSLKACNTGVDYTVASHMLFIDQSPVPADNVQMRGRIDRLTQQSKALTYKYVMADHIFERRLRAILKKKEATLAATFNGGKLT